MLHQYFHKFFWVRLLLSPIVIKYLFLITILFGLAIAKDGYFKLLVGWLGRLKVFSCLKCTEFQAKTILYLPKPECGRPHSFLVKGS